MRNHQEPARTTNATRDGLESTTTRRGPARWLLAVVWLLLAACGAEEGTVCAVDSDCSPGLWCDRRVSLCVEPLCEGTTCALPPLPSDAAQLPDTHATDTEGTDSDVESSQDTADDATEADALEDAAECAPSGESRSWIVKTVAVGEAGTPEFGHDVDHDASTCAPEGKCSDGVDNAFAGFAPVVNGFYTSAIEDGALQLGVVLTDTACGVLRLVYVQAGAEPGTWVETNASLVDGAYRTELSDATTEGDQLVVKGSGPWQIPLVVLGNLVQVPTSLATATGKIDGQTAVVTWAGAILDADLKAAVVSVEPSALDIVASLYTPDLDLDGDGTNEAISIGWITGLETASIASP